EARAAADSAAVGGQLRKESRPRRVHVGTSGQVQAPRPAAPDRAGVAGGAHPGPDDLAFKLDRRPLPLLGKPGDPEHACRLLVRGCRTTPPPPPPLQGEGEPPLSFSPSPLPCKDAGSTPCLSPPLP